MERLKTLYYEFDQQGRLIMPDGTRMSTDQLINEDDPNDMSVLHQKAQEGRRIPVRNLTLVKK
ncbi:MAG: hypothetical protein ACPG05_04960 [Bdellovibrionales bacterium]